jgi:2-keto-3-deoxy-L-rhamnonate aldolase RhmA
VTLFQNRLRQRLQDGQKSAGAWLQLANPLVAEIFGRAGFDWVMIDHEHGPGEILDLIAQLQALNGSGTSPLVRAPWNDFVTIKRILDAGVEGVLVPYVNSRDEAESVVRACCYPPRGIRGVAGSPRAAGYGYNIQEYLDRVDDELLILVAVETAAAIENLDDILQVERLDGVFIGPMDLATSMGYRFDPGQPEVQQAIATAEGKVLASGKILATLAGSWQQAHELYDRGYQMLMLMADGVTLSRVANATLGRFRETFPEG